MAEQKIIESAGMWRLNWRDLGKGALVAALVSVLLLLQQSLADGALSFHWQELGMAAVSGFVGYLIKNLLTPQQTVITGVGREEVIKSITESKEGENPLK